MKRFGFFCVAVCLLLGIASCSSSLPLPRVYPDYSFSSRFQLDSVDAYDPQVIENLDVLCRVWGYAKYHHPAFEREGVDADYELFGLLPEVAQAEPAVRNRILYRWVKELGGFESDKSFYEGNNTSPEEVTLADLSWTADTERLGGKLSGLLQKLRYAKRTPGGNRYMKPASMIGNPDMSGERATGSLDDCGYRLLYLFRFWNAIEYYFPNRNITDLDWSKIPAAYISDFALPTNKFMWRLQHELCDTHASGMFATALGFKRLPVGTDYADGRLFVTRSDSQDLLRVGDEILSVNGYCWAGVYDAVSRYESVSNREGLDRFTADYLCRTREDTVAVEVLRGGKRLQRSMPTVRVDDWWQEDVDRLAADSNIRMIADSIGYMTGLNYTKAGAQAIFDKFRNTRALIVDMRCYPREFMIFDFIARYFVPHTTHHVSWLKSTGILPGTFFFVKDRLPVNAGFFGNSQGNPDYYKGRVIVLVDASTQSQAEYTTMAFQAAPRCTVVGTQTAGADGNVTKLVLPGGYDYTWFSGLGVYYPDGANTQRTGVRIDVPVHATVEGLRAGRDEILEKALQIVRTGEYDLGVEE